MVYIAEAHPTDEWQVPSNETEGVCLLQARTLDQRLAAARLCTANLELSIPTLVDPMDNAVSSAFSAWPERIYIAGRDGRIHYRGGPGPYGFDPAEARGSLQELLTTDT